jgi:hypothetical protein
LTPKYKETLRLNWEETVRKFRNYINSWSSVVLPNLLQRKEVLQVFVTGRLWYKCQVLPLPLKYTQQIESMMEAFLWVGHVERLALDVVKKKVTDSWLGLVDVQGEGVKRWEDFDEESRKKDKKKVKKEKH